MTRRYLPVWAVSIPAVAAVLAAKVASGYRGGRRPGSGRQAA